MFTLSEELTVIHRWANSTFDLAGGGGGLTLRLHIIYV